LEYTTLATTMEIDGKEGRSVAYLLHCAADVPDDDDWLTLAERVHLDTLRIPKRRDEWRLGRWTAKGALALYADRSDLVPSRIAILADDSGVPAALIDGVRAPMTLSISHAGGRALCTVAPADIALGCDLEQIEPRSEIFVRDYFTPAECALVDRATGAQQARLVTLIWSAKEAALKALREGLRLDTRVVEIDVPCAAPGREWRPFVATYAEGGRRFDGWWHCGDMVATIATAPALDTPRALGGPARG
jgi:4'-phosphopantetheinyl transferase